MSKTMIFSFDELPLVIEGGFEAGLIAGSAEVSYFRDGEWSISGISLDGYRERSKAEIETIKANGKPVSSFERKPVELDRGSYLFNSILHRLEHEWRGKVQDAVNDAIEDDRAADADNAADYRRDCLRESA